MIPRLYAILDADLATDRGLDPSALFDIWVDSGIRLIQLRTKRMTSAPLLELATGLAQRARSSDALLILNDRADLARMSGAAGVHVGQDDIRAEDARMVVGEGRLVGLSTHSEEQARAAVREPIDYLAIGPVFATSSKERADPEVGLEGVQAASRIAASANLPLVAIGGITLERAPHVFAAGASSVAVIGDLLAGDPAERARAFVAALR